MSEDDLLVRVGLTEKQYLAALSRMEAQSKRAATSAERAFAKQNKSFVRGARQANTAASGFARGGLRQISMQMSQVAQQGAVTGNYLQALSVQAADIGLVFGTAGVLIGALVPVLYGVAQGFLNAGDGAGDLETIMNDLNTAMKDFDAAQSGASRGPAAMVDEYGALADEAQRVLEIQRQIAAVRAQEAIRTATRGVAQGLGTGAVFGIDPESVRLGQVAVDALTDRILYLRDAFMDMSDADSIATDRVIQRLEDEASALLKLEKGLGNLSEMLGVNDDQAHEIAARFAEIGAADGPMAQAEAMQSLADYIFEASNNLIDADENGQALYDSLIEAVQAALKWSAVDMAKPINDAINAVAVLRAQLNDTRGAFTSQLDKQNPDFFDPRNETGRSGVVPGAMLPTLPTRTPTVASRSSRSGGGSGGGSGASAIDRQQAEYARSAQRYIEQTRTALERYNKELKLLATLNKEGFFAEHPEAYARAVESVASELQQAQFGDLLTGINDVSDAMAQAIVTGESLGDALGNMFQQVAADLLASNIRNLMLDAFGFSGGSSSGGFLGNVLGGLFGGFRAEGGPVSPGQGYVVGENGPEFFTPRSAGTIIPNGAGGGSSTLQVALSPGLEAQILAQARGQTITIVQSAQQSAARAMPSSMRTVDQRGTL